MVRTDNLMVRLSAYHVASDDVLVTKHDLLPGEDG